MGFIDFFKKADNQEKILRLNLQQAQSQIGKPIMDGFVTSAIFAVMQNREDTVKKCQKELDDYLKSKT